MVLFIARIPEGMLLLEITHDEFIRVKIDRAKNFNQPWRYEECFDRVSLRDWEQASALEKSDVLDFNRLPDCLQELEGFLRYAAEHEQKTAHKRWEAKTLMEFPRC